MANYTRVKSIATDWTKVRLPWREAISWISKDINGLITAFNTTDDSVTSLLGRITINAGETVHNEAGSDIDFRVEGVGSANALFVQGSDGYVGIRTNSPIYPLTVNGSQAWILPAQNYLLTQVSTILSLQGLSAGSGATLGVFSNDGDGSDVVAYEAWGVGTPSSIDNRERLQVYWDTSANYIIQTEAAGTGTLRPIIVRTAGNTNQLYLGTNGEIGVGTSSIDSSALMAMSSTTKGFLPPVMTGAQVEAIGTPATGLLAYASNAGSGDVTSAGWWGYDGANWVQLG